MREQMRNSDRLVRLVEERLLTLKSQSEADHQYITRSHEEMRNDLAGDIKSLGKELALDIVSLNKKIETKND